MMDTWLTMVIVKSPIPVVGPLPHGLKTCFQQKGPQRHETRPGWMLKVWKGWGEWIEVCQAWW